MIPRTGQLIDKYLGSAGNKLDPNNVRAMLRPIGYINSNEPDYQSAERILTDTLYTTDYVGKYVVDIGIYKR